MEEAEEILKAFTRDAEKLPPAPELYYSQERLNLTREDGEPERQEEFRRRFLSIVPVKDEQGYVKAEVAKWA
jgi:predicted Asp-tRNA(Asn)/Glu-tRNA(Gln) amidotransferase subunit C